MSRIMAVHVRYNSWYIHFFAVLRKTTAGQWPNSALCGEREPRRIIFKIYFSNLPCFPYSVRNIFDNDWNKLNDFLILKYREIRR